LFRPLTDTLALVPDGASIAITKLTPTAALLGLVAMGRRDLHVIGVPTAGFGADILGAGGALGLIEAGALIMGNFGTTPNILRGLENGKVRLLESSCPMIELQLQAGASGLSFTPVPGLSGSDILKRRPDIRLIPDPYEPELDVMLAPAMRPDISIIHGLRADPDGNVVVSTLTEERLIARAGKVVLATVEEVSDDALASIRPDEEVVPEMYFDAISVVPKGAWPAACPGAYEDDAKAFKEWIAAARDPAQIAAHLGDMIDRVSKEAGIEFAYA
jgi:glutaconate CoA-transferase subunit A